MKQDHAITAMPSHRESSAQRVGSWFPVAISGQFIVNGMGFPCHIVEISKNGARITLAALLADNVECIAARLRIDGLRLFDVRIRWNSTSGIGLSFEKGRLSNAEIAKLSSGG